MSFYFGMTWIESKYMQSKQKAPENLSWNDAQSILG